ncbi:MAG: transposase [Planctomycetes bacterium]|nr:transposase [Planctomycetota bacterium]
MKRKYRKYSKEFKLGAVLQHVEKGFSIAEIARRLEVNANPISKWKAEYLADKATSVRGKRRRLWHQGTPTPGR